MSARHKVLPAASSFAAARRQPFRRLVIHHGLTREGHFGREGSRPNPQAVAAGNALRIARLSQRAGINPRQESKLGIFSTIMDKIFHHGQAAQPAAGPSAQPAAAPATPAAAAPATPAPPAQPVDVGVVLEQMASSKGGGGNYRTSIVDLLKLLDMDSSLAARKELANELNIHVGADGTAEENIALHKAVMAKLAENGGKVPDSLKAH
jgi:hypothetical protein